MTFSDYNAHTNPLFISLGIVKFNDLIFYHNALFMFDYHTGSLPDTFQKIFLPISQKHSYNTRLASRSSYSLPKIRTNYSKFNIRFAGPKTWNDINEDLKSLVKSKFKHELKNLLLQSYLACEYSRPDSLLRRDKSVCEITHTDDVHMTCFWSSLLIG
jgi:hypothetical protein